MGVDIFLTILHIISWIALLAMLPVIIMMFWIKNRSAVQCWVRHHQQPDRWLLSVHIPADSSEAHERKELQEIVAIARNCEWDASSAYRGRDSHTGEKVIGLISNSEPKNTDKDITFTHIPGSSVLRASGQPRDEGVTVKAKISAWCSANSVTTTGEVYSLNAQSYQCWEWPIASEQSPSTTISKMAEKVFELRDIAFYPIIVTPLTIAMLGTGSNWLFGIGISSIILLSGAHKFVFLHQREDATQEQHLQNY